MELDVLSAGAARALVLAAAPALQATTGAALRGEFGAVGAIVDKFLAGAPCDAIILTAARLGTITQEGRVLADTVAPLGRVRTGIAVRAGDKRPAIADRDGLRRSLLAATGIYLPDPEQSTAGAHFAKVLRELSIHDAVASHLRVFANGAMAMRELGQSHELGAIGCTQITEIHNEPGVTLAALFQRSSSWRRCIAWRLQPPHDSPPLRGASRKCSRDWSRRSCGVRVASNPRSCRDFRSAAVPCAHPTA